MDTRNEVTNYYDSIAGLYDELYRHMPLDTEPAVSFLADLANDRGGRLLELGVGTGRIALPLIERNLSVHGIDSSEEMVSKLREKPGGADLPITMGDFSTVQIEEEFDVVYIVFNTLFSLLTQEKQVACFGNMRKHLSDDGVVVVETYVPDAYHAQTLPNVSTLQLNSDTLLIDSLQVDPRAQIIRLVHSLISNNGLRTFSERHRYSFPTEMDLMARLADLTLQDRWGGWKGEPFGPASVHNCVSVFTPT